MDDTYLINAINGEKIIFDKMNTLIDSAGALIKEDFTNIRFYDKTNNKLLKHYLVNNQGYKIFIFEIPYENIAENLSLNIEILILDYEYSYFGDISIFESYYDLRNGKPSTNIGGGTLLNVNDEQIIRTTSNNPSIFKVGSFNYREILSIEYGNMSDGRVLRGFRNDYTSGNGHDGLDEDMIEIGKDVGSAGIWLNGENINTTPQSGASYTVESGMFRPLLIKTSNNKIQYYENLNNISNNATRLSSFLDGEYYYTSKWNTGNLDIAMVLSMKNILQTTGTGMTITNLNYTNYSIPNGTWIKNQNTLEYQFENDINSKEILISFGELQIPYILNANFTGMSISFNRVKNTSNTKLDNTLKLIINDVEGEERKSTSIYGINDSVVYGGSLDKWGINDVDFETFNNIKLKYRIKGYNYDSETKITISNIKLYLFYEYEEFTDYPIFSRHDSSPYFYKKIDIDEFENKFWKAELYPSINGIKIPIKTKIINNSFGIINEDINLYIKHKYNESSSFNTEHLIGMMSEDENRDSLVLAITDNMNIVTNDENEIGTERIIKYNTIDNQAVNYAESHSGDNINKNYEYCIKYLPRKVIVQSKENFSASRESDEEINNQGGE